MSRPVQLFEILRVTVILAAGTGMIMIEQKDPTDTSTGICVTLHFYTSPNGNVAQRHQAHD